MRKGVYAIAGVALTRTHELLSGLLFVGGDVALSHASAAEVQGLPLWPDPRVHVLVRNRSWRGTSDVAVHRTRTWDDEHVVTVGGMRVTTPTRTVVDLAGRLGYGQLRKMVLHVVRHRLASAADIGRALEAAGGVRGAVQLREILDGLSPLHAGTATALESLYVDVATRGGVPPTHVNYPVIDATGRLRRIDAVHLPERVPVELDGESWHSLEPDRRDDDQRERAILATGDWRPFLRFTFTDLTDRPAYVITEVRRALDDARNDAH
ncbi:MAG TPA: hypothetical protein VGA36_01215, partial [Nitriliruptorales bacterium]